MSQATLHVLGCARREGATRATCEAARRPGAPRPCPAAHQASRARPALGLRRAALPSGDRRPRALPGQLTQRPPPRTTPRPAQGWSPPPARLGRIRPWPPRGLAPPPRRPAAPRGRPRPGSPAPPLAPRPRESRPAPPPEPARRAAEGAASQATQAGKPELAQRAAAAGAQRDRENSRQAAPPPAPAPRRRSQRPISAARAQTPRPMAEGGRPTRPMAAQHVGRTSGPAALGWPPTVPSRRGWKENAPGVWKSDPRQVL